MEDLERYLSEIVQPTAEDFRKEPSNARRAFLACVAIDHSVDYLAFPKDPALWDGMKHRLARADLRTRFKEENEHFRLASEVANAFKHVKTASKSSLTISDVYERPPAMAGSFMLGLSILGDATGAVVARGRDLHITVSEAVRYLQSKIGSAV